ncbi:MAG: tetratricopeptide repeat protein [Deltaproteobacteria bacterium]
MSILSDILSRVKQQQPKRDVHPGLSSSVSAIKQEESRRRKILLFATIISIFTGLGLAAIYLTDRYALNKDSVTASQETRADGINQTAMPVEPTLPTTTPKIEPVAAPAKNKTHYVLTKPEALPAKHPTEAIESRKPEIPVEMQHPVPIQEEHIPGAKEQHIYAAVGYEKGDDLLSAASEYNKALEIEPDNYRIINKIAALLIKMGRHDEAAGYLKNSLNIRSDYIPALVNSAIVSAKTGENIEAENSLLKAISIDGTSQSALLNIALLYEREKRYDQARDYFSRLRKLGDKNGELGMQRLERMP